MRNIDCSRRDCPKSAHWEATTLSGEVLSLCSEHFLKTVTEEALVDIKALPAHGADKLKS